MGLIGKLTDSQLKDIAKNSPRFNAGGAVIINKAVLQAIVKELLEYRNND
jgi:hypothetical protein